MYYFPPTSVIERTVLFWKHLTLTLGGRHLKNHLHWFIVWHKLLECSISFQTCQGMVSYNFIKSKILIIIILASVLLHYHFCPTSLQSTLPEGLMHAWYRQLNNNNLLLNGKRLLLKCNAQLMLSSFKMLFTQLALLGNRKNC